MTRYVVTTPLSLARLLWWYGEDELWPRALALSPWAVAGMAREFAGLRASPAEVARRWPGAPPDAYLLLPVLEQLEGRRRPAARRQRRPDAGMPAALAVPEEERWRDPQVRAVAEALAAMVGEAAPLVDPADLPRLHGRWASG